MLGDKDVCATIAVKDMAVAGEFYENVLGLEKTMETPAGTFYKSGASGVFLYPSPGVAGTNQATYAAWTVDDVDGITAELKAKGVTFEHYDGIGGSTLEGDVHIMGDTKVVWFKDPDGNILSLSNQS